MTTILLLAILAFQPAVQDDGYLYKITLLRAAPGHLLDVIDAYWARIAVMYSPPSTRRSQRLFWKLMDEAPDAHRPRSSLRPRRSQR